PPFYRYEPDPLQGVILPDKIRDPAILRAILGHPAQHQQPAVRGVAQRAEIGPSWRRALVDQEFGVDIGGVSHPRSRRMEDLATDRIDDCDFRAAGAATPRGEDVMAG